MNTDYVPKKDEEFHVWATNYNNQAQLNGTRWGATTAAGDRLMALYTNWQGAWANYLLPDRGTPTTTAKKEARKNLDTGIRLYYNTNIRFNPEVTALDRSNMRLPILPGIPAGDTGLAEGVGSSISAAIRQITVYFFQERRTGIPVKGHHKPAGVHGAEICWAILDHHPVTIEEMIHSVTSTRSPYRFKFGEEERGKTLYFCIRWENGPDRVGDWSEIFSAFIP
ncbi:hypothetical protein AGMMS49944_10370 [Spirochaetia bacterium]|nr:hypothetical protein AGMMS49944_10370 [Spirochaetia bacterium]